MTEAKTKDGHTILSITTWLSLILLGFAGQFAGYYILFNVAFTMVPGPLIGGWLTTEFGIPTIINGQAGFIPTALIFQVAGLVTLVVLIPMALVKERELHIIE
jgi:MFS family permease